ncbi:hypothetical protein OHA46_32340 [Streptomyces sp. NBC_00708]
MRQNNADQGSLGRPSAAEAATDALKEVEAAQSRALLQARLLPAWYGPAAGLFLAAYAVFAVRLAETHQILIQQFVAWPVALLAVLGVRRAARRGTGVRGAGQGYAGEGGADRRKQLVIALFSMLVAACVAGGGCWALGAGVQAVVLAAAVGLGLGAWAGLARRNAVIRARLRELA